MSSYVLYIIYVTIYDTHHISVVVSLPEIQQTVLKSTSAVYMSPEHTLIFFLLSASQVIQHILADVCFLSSKSNRPKTSWKDQSVNLVVDKQVMKLLSCSCHNIKCNHY